MEALVSWLQSTLLPYGATGLFALALLDSSVLPMPQLFDLVVMLSVAVEPHNAIPYALAVTLGSTVGTLAVFLVASAGRDRVMRRPGAGAKLAWAEGLIERHGVLAVLSAATIPAPFPFKYVVIAAGFLRQKLGGFVLAVLVGRAIRFGVQALIAVVYGEAIIDLFTRYALPATLALLVLLVALVVAVRVIQRRWGVPDGSSTSPTPAEPPTSRD